MSVSPKVYIILVNWKGWADTLECLESVFRLEHANYEVVVCDNDSGDGSVQHILDWAAGRRPTVHAQNPALEHLVSPNIAKPIRVQLLDSEQARNAAPASESASGSKLTVIQTGGNLGFAGGNNVGIRYAQSRGDLDYVWLLNNDTVVESFALTALMKRAVDANDMGIVGSTLVFYRDIDKLQAMGGACLMKGRALSAPLGYLSHPSLVNSVDLTELEKRMSYVVGASMLVSNRFLQAVGLMCEDYFLYFEELDWTVRGVAKGFGCLYAPGSVVFHKVGASTDKNKRSKLTATIRYSYLNRISFTEKFFPEYLLRVRVRIFLESVREMLRGNFEEGWYALGIALRFGASRG